MSRQLLTHCVQKATFVLMWLVVGAAMLLAQDCSTPIAVYPWSDDFEAGLSPCYQQPIGGTDAWTLHQGGYQSASGFIGYPRTAHSGIWNLWFFSETVGTTEKIILPVFDLGYSELSVLKFWHAQFPWANAQDVLKVYYKPDLASEWVLLQTYDNAVENWTERIITLPETGANYWIAFEGISNFGRGIVIDDISVSCLGCASDCPRPSSATTILHQPNYFDGRLIWTSPNLVDYESNLLGYHIYQADGTPYVEDLIVDTFLQISNLEPVGDWGFGITAVYANGCESEMIPCNFTMTTPPEINIPKNGTITYTTCNGVVYDDGGPTGDYSNNANGTIIIQPNQSGFGSTIQGNFNIENNNDKLYIYEGAGTGGTLLATYTGSNGTIPLTTSDLGPLTLRFTSNGSVTKSGFSIQVSCEPIEDCLPPFSLVTNVVAADDVQVSWVSSGDLDVAWNLEYGPVGFVPGLGQGTAVNNITTTSYTITDANPISIYHLYIQTVCSDGGVSVWSAPYTFVTPCSVFNVPYTEGFEATDFPPQCWLTAHTAGSGSSLWQRNTSASYVHSGSASAKLPDQQMGNRTDLVTGQINIPEANAYQVTFWMYRSDYSGSTPNEGVKVWASTTPDTTGGVALLHVRRQYNLEPVENQVGWYEYQAPITVSGNLYIVFQGISEYGNASYIDDVLVDVMPDCPKPHQLTASLPTANTIDLGWTNGGSETSWNIEYGLEGFRLGEGITVSNITTNPFTLTGLSATTDYSYYVQANCPDGGVSDWSDAANFSTTCGAVDLPYIENFDNYGTGSDAFPPCWNRPVTYGTSTIFPSCVTAQKVSEPASLRFQSATGTPTFAITSAINADIHNVMVSFQLKAASVANSGVMQVGVMSDPFDLNTFELVQTITPTTNAWTLFEVELTNTALTGTGRHIAFRHQTNSTSAFFWLDDVVVDVAPDCAKPTDVVASNPQESSIQLAWTAGGSESSWNIQYGLEGFALGEGTIVSNVSNNPYTLNGLQAASTYNVYIQANCPGGGNSSWSSVCTFTTGCGAVMTPYSESFDTYGTGSDAFPPCWSRPVTSGTTTIFPSCVTAQKVSSPASLRFQSTIGTVTYALTPPFAEDINTLQVAFQLKASSSTTSGTIEVGLMSSLTDINTFELVEVITPTSTAWTAYEINFATTTITGTGKSIAFRHQTNANSASFWLDDVEVTVVPTCPTPDNLTVSVQPTSATLMWRENGTATGWNIEYGVSGFAQGTGTTVTSTSTAYTIEGLMTGTPYQCYVQSNCGAGDLSEWFGPVDFIPSSGINDCVNVGNTTTGGYYLPLNTFYNYSYSQQIFTADELEDIGFMPGVTITSIAFQYFYSTPQTKNPVTIYLAEVSRDVFTGSSDWVPEADMEQVFTGAINFDNSGEDYWFDIEFSNPYVYGGDNLVVAVLNNHGVYTTSSNSTFYKHTSTGYKTLNYYTDGSALSAANPPSSGYTGSDRSNTRFCIVSGGSSMCRPPRDLDTISITSSTVSLDWVPRGEEMWWDIEYGPAGHVPGTGEIVSAAFHPYDVTGLSPFTTYDFYIRSVCSDVDVSVWKGITGVTTQESCLRPSQVAIAGITESTATVTWHENGWSTVWNIEYGPAGFELGTGVSLNGIHSTSYTIVGLEPGVPYEIYVQAVCSSESVSAWSNPVMVAAGNRDCVIVGSGTSGVYDLPLNTFYKYSYSQQIYKTNELSDQGMAPGSAINTIAFQYFYNTAQTKNPVTIYLGEVSRTSFSGSSDWEPVANLTQVYTGSIQFDNTGEDYWVTIELDDTYAWGGNNLLVAVLNNNGNYTTGSSSTFYTHTATSGISLEYHTDGSAISAGSPANGNTGNDRNNIKFCFLNQQTSTCPRPFAATVMNVTTTTAQLGWSAESGPTTWNIEFGPVGFVPAHTPTIDHIVPPYTLTNLTPNTDYAFYVQSNCSNNTTGEWSGPYYFHTLCDMVYDVPFFEGFEGGVKPDCWENIQAVGSETWTFTAGCFEATPEEAFEGSYNALLYSGGNRHTTRLVTPTINLSGLTQTPVLSFAYAQPKWGFSQDVLSILVKNAVDGSWTKVIEFGEDVTDWREESVVLPNPSATYQIAFEVNGEWGHGVALDAVAVGQGNVAPINGQDAVCANTEEIYTTTSGMTNYEWEVIGGEIVSGSGTNTITVLWGDSGNGLVRVRHSGAPYKNHINVVISGQPVAVLQASSYTICTGQSVTLSVLGEGNCLWSTGETTSSIVVSPTTTTTYTVMVYFNTQCATNLEAQISVNDFNGAFVEGVEGVCYGESATLTALGGIEFLWSTGETTASINVSPENGTYYSVIITNAIGCSKEVNTYVSVINPTPVSNVTAEGLYRKVYLQWTPVEDVNKYYVYRNEQLLGSSVFPNYEDNEVEPAATYCYNVTSYFKGCESDFSEEACATVSAIEETDAAVVIYPNPADARFTVEAEQMRTITIYNILGQQVESQNVDNQTLVDISTASYESGIYLLRIELNNGTVLSKRVVITH